MDGAATAFVEPFPTKARYVAAEEQCLPSTGPSPEKQYGDYAVGVVLSGWVDYRAQGGAATTAPGAAIFGNAGERFSCRRLGASGNRRLVVSFDPGFLEEVASDCGLDEARFPVATLPPGRASARMFGLMRKLALARHDREEAAYALVGGALKLHADPGREPRVSRQDRQRIEAVARHVETAYAEPCTLGGLAELAGLSRYHFLRRFREVVGQSPTQHVILTRLRAASEALLETRASIAQVALDVGFNDISHFNACFRAAYGCSPRAWRAGAG